jgi:hypothetical protein
MASVSRAYSDMWDEMMRKRIESGPTDKAQVIYLGLTQSETTPVM